MFAYSWPISPSESFLPIPKFTPSELTARLNTFLMTHHNLHVKHCHLTLCSVKKNVSCLGACGGLDAETVGGTECAEDDSECGVTDIDCVAEERGFSAEEMFV